MGHTEKGAPPTELGGWRARLAVGGASLAGRDGGGNHLAMGGAISADSGDQTGQDCHISLLWITEIHLWDKENNISGSIIKSQERGVMEKALHWSSDIYFHLSSMFIVMKLTVVWISVNDRWFAVAFFTSWHYNSESMMYFCYRGHWEQEKPVCDKLRTPSFYSCQVYL